MSESFGTSPENLQKVQTAWATTHRMLHLSHLFAHGLGGGHLASFLLGDHKWGNTIVGKGIVFVVVFLSFSARAEHAVSETASAGRMVAASHDTVTVKLDSVAKTRGELSEAALKKIEAEFLKVDDLVNERTEGLAKLEAKVKALSSTSQAKPIYLGLIQKHRLNVTRATSNVATARKSLKAVSPLVTESKEIAEKAAKLRDDGIDFSAAMKLADQSAEQAERAKSLLSSVKMIAEAEGKTLARIEESMSLVRNHLDGR